MTTMRYPVSIKRRPLDARFELAGHRGKMAEVLQKAGLPAPDVPSTIVSVADVRIAWIGPRRMIVSAPIDQRMRLATALKGARATDVAVAAVDVTGATVSFLLDGSGAGDVLAQGFAHDVASLAHGAERIMATDGWGVAVLLQCRDGCFVATVDATYGDYVEHMLRAAAGLPTVSKPGVMRAPPPPLRVTA